DEPLSNLDAQMRVKTRSEIRSLQQSLRATMIYVTHDQEEAMTMATRIGVMSEGKILQIGAPSDIYETPNCRFVADFIGTVNLFKGKVTQDEPDHVVIESRECKHYVSHGITGTAGMEVHVAIRPEKMSISAEAPTDSERESAAEVGFNVAQGVIHDLAYLGSLTTYHVKLDSGMVVKVTHTNAARHNKTQLTWDDKVYVWWCGSDVVVLTS
ncbi:MAG: ABC transporter ATP-binding protein, partial [Burkholderiales bacterium]|nr:ABC transporter ATP-binding protein [Burkholderiales bacterium]